MMCIGGGMGSTAGAIKQYRFIIALKSFYWSIRDRLAPSNKFYPHTIYRLGKNREVTKEEVYESYGYIVIYIAVLLVGSIIITILGRGEFSASDALFEFASALSGTGLSVGVTSLSWANSVAINWVLIVGMFIGRLEIIAVYFAVFRLIRDILRKETI
jgi:trk system potassium uptake protein TrkH